MISTPEQQEAECYSRIRAREYHSGQLFTNSEHPDLHLAALFAIAREIKIASNLLDILCSKVGALENALEE